MAQPPTKARRGTKQRGHDAETAASRFLESQGLTPLVRNYRTRGGEIDLIMRDGETVVFVEVRSRRHAGYAHPAETVDRRKQRHIILAGQHYLQSHRLSDRVNCRFDVVAITGPERTRKIEWIKDAFDA